MISPDRMRRLSALNIATADRSHLQPPPVKDDFLYYSNINWARQRIDSLPRSTCSLLCVPALPLGAFFQPAQHDNNLVDYDALERQQKRDAEKKLEFRAVGLAEDDSPEFHFIDKNRHSLPGVNVKKAINLYFSGLDGSSPEMAEKFGFYNIQTNGGRPPKIAINKRDFLAG